MQTIGFIMRLHFFSQALSAVWHYGKEVFAGIVTHEMMQLRSEWHVHLIYKETHGSGMLEILKVLVFFYLSSEERSSAPRHGRAVF